MAVVKRVLLLVLLLCSDGTLVSTLTIPPALQPCFRFCPRTALLLCAGCA